MRDMLNCVSSNGSVFDNEVFKMNQTPSSHSSLFGQLQSNVNLSKYDFNGVGTYNQSAPTNGLSPSLQRFASGMTQNTNIYQQALAQFRTDNQFRTSTSTPLGYNDNEFPSLTLSANRGAAGFGIGNFGQLRSTVGFGRAGFANLLKQQVNAERTQPEFQIQSEDFPALPKAQNDIATITGKRSDTPTSPGTVDNVKSDRILLVDTGKSMQQQGMLNSGLQIQSDGTLSGLPPGMLSDQFGMVGLFSFIRVISTEPNVVSLALGQELTKLGINLNAHEKNLYQTFGGPWAELPCRAQDIDCQVPPEYATNATIAENLAPIKLNRYGEDLLFYLFYNFCGEVLQLAAAAELYNRDWRYHKEERVWVSRCPGIELTEKTPAYARGVFFVFDPNQWTKIKKELVLEFSKLEDKPMLPPQPQQIAHSQMVQGLANIGLANNMHNS